MDGNSFDRFARALGVSASRRAGLGAAVGALIAGAGVGAGVVAGGAEAAGTRKNRKPRQPRPEGPCGDGSRKENLCTKDKQCCTGVCSAKPTRRNKDGKGRCRCIQRGRACNEDRNCCGTMTCNAGKCGPGRPAAIPTGKPCTETDTCADAAASCVTYFSGSPGGTFCLLPNGTACVGASDCESSDCAGSCRAETCTVCAAGCQYSALDPALAGVAAGGVITIAEGTWTTTSQGLVEKSLAVRPCNRAAVVIEGTSSSALFLDSPTAAATLTIRDLTVRNPTAEGVGVSVQGYAAYPNILLLRNVTVTQCDGSGLAVYGPATLDMANSTVSKNRGVSTALSNRGGGIYALGSADDPAILNLVDSTITGNVASDKGGGIYAEKAASSLVRMQVVRNSSRGNDGGGAHFDTGTVTLAGCNFNENYAGGDGGGAVVRDADCTISDSHFDRNTGDDAGGLWVRSVSVEVTCTLTGATTIDDNTGMNDSGGMEVNGFTSPITVTIGGTTSISRNRVPGNGDPSGGLRLQGDTVSVTLKDDVLIADNTSTSYGGGVSLTAASHSLTLKDRVTITGNTSQNSGGGGVALWGTSGSPGSGGILTIIGGAVRITGNSAQNGSGILSYNGIVNGAANAIVSGNTGAPDCQTTADNVSFSTVACANLA